MLAWLLSFLWFLTYTGILPVLILYYLIFICGIFLEEGTGAIALKNGAYYKTLICKQDHRVNEPEGDIVRGYEWHPFGGWRWVGLWPYFRLFVKREFHWTKTAPGQKELEDREDFNLYRFLIRFYTYGIKSDDAEDVNGVPVHSLWSFTAWTSNLRKAWLDTQDWFTSFRDRTKPYIRHHVGQHTYENIIAKPDIRLDKLVEETLRGEGIFKALNGMHGLTIEATECVDISPDAKYREDTTKTFRGEQEAKRRRSELVGSTSGAVMEMIADQTGTSLKTIKREFKKDPDAALKKYESLIKLNQDFVVRSMGLNAGAVRQYYFSGAQGGMDIIALLSERLREGGSTPAKSESKKERKNPAENRTPEEMKKAHERIKQGLPPFED